MSSLDIKILNDIEWLTSIKKHSFPSRQLYRAMYSTWWNGIVTDPNLMLIPIDDHQVHRGDAVFEAFKYIHNKIYLEKEHLDRMERSAQGIGLTMPVKRSDLLSIIDDTVKASKLDQALIRLFLGRGPGSFSANPYESIGTQLHVIVTELIPPSEEKVKNGVTLSLSKISVKDPYLAQIKSCNYLPNVLMKKEAVDLGVDFTVGVEPDGSLTEGSTENLILLTKDDELIRPDADCILAGTTMIRVFELAKDLLKKGLIKGMSSRPFYVEDLVQAKEVLMVGTTINVLSVTKFNGKAVSNGRTGPIGQQLYKLLLRDQGIS